MSFALEQIPGYREAVLSARSENIQTQEDDWLNLTQTFGGVKVRRARLRDYVLILRYAPAILHRQLPDMKDVQLLLWILSPERELWDYEPTGWRKWFPRLRRLARWRHGRAVQTALDWKSLEQAMAVYALESDEAFELPEKHPFTQCVDALFHYFDNLFAMTPAGMKGGAGTGMYFLCSWFGILQRNFHLTQQEIWEMPLPILFARLREQQGYEMKGQLPDFNAKSDALNRRIMTALRTGETTVDDLLAGKFKLN